MKKIYKFISILILPITVYSINDYDQQQVIELQQIGLSSLSKGGNLKDNENKIFVGVTIKGNLDKSQIAWQEAVKLAPDRIDLRYALASTEVLNGKTNLAREEYSQIESYTPNNTQLVAIEAAYANAMGEKESYITFANRLSKMDDNDKYFYSLAIINEGFTLAVNQNIDKTLNNGKKTAIIILGYALHNDGSIDTKLTQRLQQGLDLFKLNPNAYIIVSGGVAQNGTTEAYQMRQWLLDNGVDKKQILVEDKSIDTVGNAIYSINLLQDIKINNIVIVSSASHLRRATTIFKQVAHDSKKDYQINNLAAWDFPESSLPLATEVEKSLIVRDTFRAAGVWAYPGMLR